MAYAQKESYMNLMIEKASHAFLRSGGNPCVGAMLVHNDRIIGEGIYEKYGGKHAEVNCIESVAEKDTDKISASTLYVTLEPCCIFGKTPPCTNKIIESNIKHVIIAVLDPNPLVAGNGVRLLEEAGITVEVGISAEKAQLLIRKFKVNILENRPFIAIKTAVSRDGYAGKKEESVWLTNEYSRIQAHKLRGMFEGIVVGYNTVNLDNPALTNREFFIAPFYDSHPVKIIIDRDSKLLPNRKLFNQEKNIIITSVSDYINPNPQTTEILSISSSSWSWDTIFNELWQKGFKSLLIEGGPRLQKSIVKETSWDEGHILSSNTPLGTGIRAVSLVGKQVDSLSLGSNSYDHILPHDK